MSETQVLVDDRSARYEHFDKMNRPYVEWQIELLKPFLGRRVLEVGCGVGSILDILGPRDMVFGIDMDAEMVRRTAARFEGRSGYGVARMDITAPPPDDVQRLAAMEFDSVIAINVLEHIADDAAALRSMASLARPGGRIGVLVPAHPSLYGRYDALDGHLRRYTRSGLLDAIASAGLSPLMIKRFNAIGAIGWWWQYKVLRQEIHGRTQFGLMTRLVPMCRIMEQLIPPPFGLSLVAVCEKGPRSS